MAEKKIPLRKCVGCNEMKPKKELIRVVKSPEGDVSIDLIGKKSGRGAYICHSKECFLKAKKQKRFEKTLGTEIPESVYEIMLKELGE